MMKAISRLLRLEPTKILKGVDMHGNKYFEIPPQKYYLSQREVLKLKRVVEPPEHKHDLGYDAAKNVPHEWLAWMQWRRDDPPEPGEVEENLARMHSIKHKAAQLEKQHEAKKVESNVKAEEKLDQAEVDSWSPK